MEKIIGITAEICGINTGRVSGCIKLLEEGATIPFISRYRKEATGGLDETEIDKIKNTYNGLKKLEKRKITVIETIREQDKLTDELEKKIIDCYDSNLLEDIYMPYKPKRKTKATAAKEKGLEPLAGLIMKQDGRNPEESAERFLNDNVEEIEDALDGACDIIAEWMSESIRARNSVRRIFSYEGEIVSKVVKNKEEEGIKFKDYFEYRSLLKRIPSHRLLAIMRGENEGILKISLEADDEKILSQLENIFVKANSPSGKYIIKSLKDSYKRLIKPSIGNEILAAAKEKADDEAIRVFAENLRQLLLSAPLGQKRILAIDPGFRTGCKVVCIDEHGDLLHNETIYPHPPQSQTSKSMSKINHLVETYDIDAIAVGDGTAGRETENMLKKMRFERKIQIFMVSEDGASVYSASKIAREEFPEYDVTVRGAVSIGRRLMDPLAELVKIDPKSIGVGQYQHDVDQSKLKNSLDTVTESCVNKVGVNLNTASVHLLSYVSGIGPALAKNIVDYRSVNGGFASRKELHKVPRLGNKAFEQCAGFMRITNSNNPLDNSAVHPESCHIAEKMAKDNKIAVEDLIGNDKILGRIDPTKYITENAGLPTITDIIEELKKPGRDPRRAAKVFEFDPNVRTIDDLIPGMELPGIIPNVTNFGAFVDLGIKQDGLIHISRLAKGFVADPTQIVKLHEHVTVKVIEVDKERKRINLERIE
ncbi:MAG: RNA-binding transcriptional accessory protein [Rikenellaceae bacterium]|nr:RNA-binding transcriptional accessory protein [Rikenellaceae bacterium]